MSGLSRSECSVSTRGGLVHIKRIGFRQDFFATYFRIVAAVQSVNVPVQFGIHISIALPTPNENYVSVSQNLWCI